MLTNFKVQDSDIPELVNITSDRLLDTMFRAKLFKCCHRYDKRLEKNGTYKYRNQRIAIEITKSDFYQYGWALSKTDESMLNNFLEIRCRTILLSYLSAQFMVTPVLAHCIRLFYKNFGYDENTWPAESIRRIWNRDKKIDKEALKTSLNDKIFNFIIVQLYENKTISQQGKKNYEDISI